MYKIYHVNALDTRNSGCSATKKTTPIFKLPSHDSKFNEKFHRAGSFL